MLKLDNIAFRIGSVDFRKPTPIGNINGYQLPDCASASRDNLLQCLSYVCNGKC